MTRHALRKPIDAILKHENRTLRTLPGKLLLGPTGKRLFADYLDKTPGFWGRIDFIHKLNLPGLFAVTVDGRPAELEAGQAVWMPSHLTFAYEDDEIVLREARFITWEDVAVSVQRWTNKGSAPMRLRLLICDGFVQRQDGEAILLSRECTCHDFALTGAVVGGPLVRDGFLVLQPGETAEATIACAIGEFGRQSQAECKGRALACATREDPVGRQRAEYDRWFEDVPVFDSDDALLNQTWWYRWFLLRHNYAEPGTGNFRHGTFYEGRSHKMVKDAYEPWGHEFTQLIPMSTPMHLLDGRWKGDPTCCQEAARTLLDSMDDRGIFRTMMTDKFGFTFGNFNQWALYQLCLVHADDDFAREVLPGFKENVRGVWDAYRNDCGDLQIAYNHRRTGKEYQPSFWFFTGFPDDALNEAGYTWLKRVDLSVYLYLNALGTQRLCERVGDADAGFFASLASRLREQVLKEMWDAETGFFYDLHHETHAKAFVKSVVGVYPLWAEMTGPEHLRVLEYLFDPDFFATGSAFASVAKDSPVFMPQGSWKGHFLKGRDGCMWDGPSWPFTTSIALDAIAMQSKANGHRYDEPFGKFLREYAWEHYRNKSLSEPYLVEHYNAVTGEPLSDEVDYCHSYFIDLIVRHVAGLTPLEGGFEVHPVDIGLARFDLENVTLQGHTVSIAYRRGAFFQVVVDGAPVYTGTALTPYVHAF